MPIAMRCPGCETRFEFADDLDGKRIKCKTCGDIFRVERPSRSRREDDDDDDRPSVRSDARRSKDDERPSGRHRRPMDDDVEDDRPSSRYRRPVGRDEHDDDDRPRRARVRDDDESPRKKKVHPLLILGPLAGVAVLGIVVVVILVSRGGKKGGIFGGDGDVVKAPAKSCPLEVPEKDTGTLVIPDSGNTFGLLRKIETKKWVFEPYDPSAGRRLGKLEMSDMDEPRSVTLSPDGKHLMVLEGGGFGNAPPTISLWSVPENRPLARKWEPYPPPRKAVIDPPGLYRAEFIGNDKIITISTARFVDVWPLPKFDPKIVDGVQVDARGDQLGKDDRFGQNTNDKYQRQLAFTPDHKLMAVWNGNGYTFINTLDGTDRGATLPVSPDLVKEMWPREPLPDRVKATGVAFSPDGSTLAGILTHDFGSKKHALCLWNVKEQKPPAWFPIPSNQFNDSPAIYWWGNRYVVTHGARTEGMLIDKLTGLAKRQLMGPSYQKYSFGRDGRLWYAISLERNDPATVHVVDGIEPDQLTEPDDYEQIMELKEEFFLRRLWLEPPGVTSKPLRYDPPLHQRLIRRP
jgi:hypothetical protein